MEKHKFFLITLVFSLTLSIQSGAFAVNSEKPHIAKWYGNKNAAVSLRFDDSGNSHVTYVIPQLNEYGIKATFMINPGLDRYQKNKAFWENKVPKMGHELGNHTMHHRGAKTPKEADFEIGEVSRLIWKLYPNRSKLLVFASGGGAKWGGNNWKDASIEYKKLVNRYHLIDLYDGYHPHLSADSRHGIDEIIGSIHKAIQGNNHQAIVFHKVGKPDLIERMKSLYRGYGLIFSRDSFEKLLAFLRESESIVWVAPLGDILKYETERENTRLDPISRDSKQIRLVLTVGTDEEAYDHDLTLVIPNKEKQKVKSILHGTHRVDSYTDDQQEILVNVKPVSGAIEIYFH